jgi:predicted methyltransferase
MAILEIWPGAGCRTEILAPYAKATRTAISGLPDTARTTQQAFELVPSLQQAHLQTANSHRHH